LDLAGRKGKSHGYAGVYEKHALILVNHEKKATGGEVYDFSEKIIKDIEEKFGVSLEPEVVIV
jgi:UDP-N-acetylmuramate dehydrogenase